MIPNEFSKKTYLQEMKNIFSNLVFFEFINIDDKKLYSLFFSVQVGNKIISQSINTHELTNIVYLGEVFMKIEINKFKTELTSNNARTAFFKSQERLTYFYKNVTYKKNNHKLVI